MTVTRADLEAALPPAGALWPELEEDDTGEVDQDALGHKLNDFLNDAENRTALIADELDRDRKTLAWGRYRAFSEAYEIRILTPSSVEGPDQGRSSYLQFQLEELGRMRDAALADYEFVADTTVLERPGSKSAPIRLAW